MTEKEYDLNTPALLLYDEGLKNMIKNNSSEPIPNDSACHAVLLIKNLLASAKESVYIFSGKLSNSVYGYSQVTNELKKVLQNNINIKILINDSVEDFNEFTDLLKKYNIPIIPIKKKYRIDNHFCVIDKKRFRLETNEKKRKAIACMNNEEIGKELHNVFDDLYFRSCAI